MHSLSQFPLQLKSRAIVHMSSSVLDTVARLLCNNLSTPRTPSTGNMRRHVKTCWGEDALNTADKAKDINEAWTKVVQDILRDSSITTPFKQKDKQSVTYSSRPYMQSKIRWDVDNNVSGIGYWCNVLKGWTCVLGFREPAPIQYCWRPSI